MTHTGFTQAPSPVTLEGHGVRLVPLTMDHVHAVSQAAADGELWSLRVTSVPEPVKTGDYVRQALDGQAAGHMLPFAVIDPCEDTVIGSTRYHDIVPAVARLEIGYTWYSRRYQRTHVNTACKLLLLSHAFETLGAAVVGWRTDNDNFVSQRAIERLGAHRDGVIRHHALRRDGTVRDTVMYSLLAAEWPTVRHHVEHLLRKPRW